MNASAITLTRFISLENPIIVMSKSTFFSSRVPSSSVSSRSFTLFLAFNLLYGPLPYSFDGIDGVSNLEYKEEVESFNKR